MIKLDKWAAIALIGVAWAIASVFEIALTVNIGECGHTELNQPRDSQP